MDNDNTINKYDRMYGSLKGDNATTMTKPSTVKDVMFTGQTVTYVVQTARNDERGGDHIFIECMDETGVTRLALPPRVANAIASQRESLTSRRRSLAGKRLAKERKDRGEVPGFMRGKTPASKKVQ
jgi:hypothetical protein